MDHPTQPPDDRDALSRERQESAFFSGDQAAAELIDALPLGVAIVDRSLRIVAANQRFHAFTGAAGSDRLAGVFLGEALRCSHEAAGGGGSCLSCGIKPALMAAEARERYVGDCRIRRGQGNDEGTRDLRLTVMPMANKAGQFTAVSAQDIEAEKRLGQLESIFHHDLRNTASVLQGAVEALNDMNYTAAADQLNALILSSTRRLVSEIESQTQLMKAERGLLRLDIQPIDSYGLLGEIVEMYDSRPEFHNCRVLTAAAGTPLTLESDPVLLGRVLGNMVKNALEACRPGDTVTVGADGDEGRCRFWVRNPTLMPASARGRLFTRSYSTKGSERGLGTYGMKMLAERYLSGDISFSSTPEQGTIFELTLPCNPAKAP